MCFYCAGKEMLRKRTNYTVSLSDIVIVVKNVPCEECAQCGEKYFSDAVMEQLEEIVANAKKAAAEIYVTDFTKKIA